MRHATSASLWRVTWKLMIDLPNAWRSREYAIASRYASSAIATH